jgi:hypothetical protein
LLAGPEKSTDVGRFPEFFIYRILVPFLIQVESDERLQSKLSELAGVIRSSDDLIGLLPPKAKQWVDRALPNWVAPVAEPWCDAILERVSSELSRHIAGGNQVRERLISTIFWYFRETLRFGSHSRVSMRYDRVLMENIAEALAVASVLDQLSGEKRRAKIARNVQLLCDVVATHESYCGRFTDAIASPQNDRLLQDYDSALGGLGAEQRAVRTVY